MSSKMETQTFWDANGFEYTTPEQVTQRKIGNFSRSSVTIISKKQHTVPLDQEDDDFNLVAKKKVLKKKAKESFKTNDPISKKKKIEESPQKSVSTKLADEILLSFKQPENFEEVANSPSPKVPLSDTVIAHLKRLKGVLPTGDEPSRHYSRNRIKLPKEIQYFLDVKWPTKRSMGSDVKVKFKNDDFQAYEIEFTEYDLLQWDDYKFLRDHNDACLIGDGNVIFCTLLNQENLDDFNIFIIDDEDKDSVEGPFKISEFLDKLVVDDGVRAAK